jgi:hypothetical protein
MRGRAGCRLGGGGISEIQADVVAEGRRLAELAERSNLPLRLLGGVAVRLRAQGELAAGFRREYNDLDWVTARGRSPDAQRFFERAGYAPVVRFNALHGKERLLFMDEVHDRQVDVFVGAFRMCHEIDLNGRLRVDPLTLPLADLLLTKLQVIELNRKDVTDALALMHDHDVGDADGGTINGAYIASLCARDWGLWRTFTQSLANCRSRVDDYALPEDARRRITERFERLEARIEAESKSRKWKLRAKLGDRKRWYELPEEVYGG